MATTLTWPGLDDPAFNQLVTVTLTSVLVAWGLISIIRACRK